MCAAASSAALALYKQVEFALCRHMLLTTWLTQSCPGSVSPAQLAALLKTVTAADPDKKVCDAGSKDMDTDIRKTLRAGGKAGACTFYKAVFDEFIAK